MSGVKHPWRVKGTKGQWARLGAVGRLDELGRVIGTHVASKGHLRYSAGPHRNKYVHRVIAAQCAAVWCYYPVNGKDGLPEGWDVHHLDGNPQNNCPVHNLCLMPHSLHAALTQYEVKWRRAYLEGLGNPVDNPIDRNDDEDDRVPF